MIHVDVQTIDQINILNATLQGMQQAVQALARRPDEVLVDGNKCPDFGLPAKAIVGGDGKIAAISAASILAKSARDALMIELHEEYPGYGFAQHKGYGTQQHLEVLKKQGPCVHHRKSFAPVRNLLQAEWL